MIRKLFTINGVFAQPKVFKNVLFYYDIKHVLHVRRFERNDELSEELIKLDNDSVVVERNDQLYILEDKVKHKIAIEEKIKFIGTESLVTDQNERIIEFNELKKIHYHRSGIEGPLKVSLINKSDNSKCWSKLFSDFFAVNHIRDHILLFKARRVEIAAVDLSSGGILWRRSFPEPESISGSIFIKNNILFVQSRGPSPIDKTFYQGIDLITGELKWRYEAFYHYFHQHPETNLLHSFGGSTYKILDPESGELLVEKTIDEIPQYHPDMRASANLTTFQDDALYFTAEYGDNKQDVFGKVDASTQELVFLQQIDLGDDVKLGPPVVNGDKVYVKDGLSNLYIYQMDV